ncbi:MAG: tryptophan synthase subunit alpha, partial [Luteimonas sp.]
MNRIDSKFHALHAAGRKALVPFITAGDPSLESTVPVMHALVAAGADVIELGVPFSDPMADGPTIQRSSERALARKAGLGFVLEAVRAFREDDSATPVVLMGYLNPIEIRGAQRFAADAAGAGVDGILLVDLPPEEAADLRA